MVGGPFGPVYLSEASVLWASSFPVKTLGELTAIVSALRALSLSPTCA